MKRSLALIFTLASGIALSAAAQTSPAPAAAPAAQAGPAKVAVIAFTGAVQSTNEFQRNFADLQKKYEPKRTQLKTMAEEVDTLQKQLQAQSSTLSDAERASKAKIIDDKKKSAQRFAEDAQNDLQGEIQEIFQGVASKFFDVLEAYAKEQGFTLVLDGTQSQQQAPVVLYATSAADISKAVVDAYNVKSGVPAPPPQPPSAPGPQAAPKPRTPAAPATH
jgi:outer membrane protein